ncbi:hypothetical protein [Celeribacter sp.]|uniref:hypothetical protein n=1 Tax=Celeribacter sp. TaxID=1890673 RepID=UPI003A92EE55
MINFLVVAVLSFTFALGLAKGAQAGETFLLLEDDEELLPPYKQWWYATPSDHIVYNETYEVFIRGDGKRGDFFGILEVDCLNAEDSEWLATGGWLNSESVPTRAIAKLRLEICS